MARSEPQAEPTSKPEPAADTPKPKWKHGWRAFLLEIGTIVIGVLIALVAEQVVDTLRWNETVGQAEHAIRLELRDDDDPQAYARLAISGCIDRSLDAIQAAVDAGQTNAQVNALARGYRLAFRTWDMEAWRAMLASDAASHIPPERMIMWSTPYQVIPTLSEMNAREAATADDLMANRHRAGPLAEGDAERITLAVQRLRGMNHAMTASSQVLLAASRDVGVTVPPDVKRKTLAQVRSGYGPCVVEPPPESALVAGQVALQR